MPVTAIVAETGEKVKIVSVHPVADLFPLFSTDEMIDLADDITERGQLFPVTVTADGVLLDGRNRLAACGAAKVEPLAAIYIGDDPDGYALSANVNRRNLTKGQTAMIAAQALFLGNNQTSVAASSGTSQAMIAKAAIVLEWAPDLVAGVVAGAVPLNEAYNSARDRKKASTSVEASMSALTSSAPDLADLVAEERMTLSEAIGAQREREREATERITRTVGYLRRYIDATKVAEVAMESPDADLCLAELDDDERDFVLARLETAK